MREKNKPCDIRNLFVINNNTPYQRSQHNYLFYLLKLQTKSLYQTHKNFFNDKTTEPNQANLCYHYSTTTTVIHYWYSNGNRFMNELLIQNQNFNIWNPMAELTPMMTSGFSMGATFDLGPARPFSCRLDLLPPFIITPGNNILLPRLDLPWLSLDCDPS